MYGVHKTDTIFADFTGVNILADFLRYRWRHTTPPSPDGGEGGDRTSEDTGGRPRSGGVAAVGDDPR